MQTKKLIRILVVEDEADQRDIVEQIIADAGYSVVTAEDAESALKLQQLQPVDLVFSDWKLPGMDGLQLLEKLRKLYPELAFVMATGHGSIDHAISAIRANPIKDKLYYLLWKKSVSPDILNQKTNN